MVWTSMATAAGLLWRRLGMLVLANVLWLVLSLPIVTWPAATGGLFFLVRRVVAEELEAGPEARIGDFWEGFKAYGLRSSLLTLLDLAGVIAIVVALVFYGGRREEPFRWLIGPIGLVGLVWLSAQLYVYPLLLQRPGGRAWEILREALLIVLAYPLASLSLLLTSLVLLAASIVLAGPVLFVFFSAMAMLQTVTLRQVLETSRGVEETPPSGGDPSPWQGETPPPSGGRPGRGHREGAGLGGEPRSREDDD